MDSLVGRRGLNEDGFVWKGKERYGFSSNNNGDIEVGKTANQLYWRLHSYQPLRLSRKYIKYPWYSPILNMLTSHQQPSNFYTALYYVTRHTAILIMATALLTTTKLVVVKFPINGYCSPHHA